MIISDPIVMIGLFLTLGLSLSFVFQRIGAPHVVIYLLIGFVLANSLYSNLDFYAEFSTMFIVTENVALGLIGFRIGTELKLKEILKDRKVLLLLLTMEAGGAFIVVFTLVSAITGDILVGLLLGAFATATAPAATVAVLKKLRAKGSLTTKVQWILALDDVIAVLVIETVLVIVTSTFGETFSFHEFSLGILHELGYAIILGIVVGFILDYVVERMVDDLEMMEFTLGIVLLTIGIAHYVHTSVIFTTMIIGAVTTNVGGANYEKAGDLLEIILSPIVTIFFVLFGARITFADFIPFPWLALVYLGGRSIGKIVGAYSGGRAANLEPCVRNNIGFGLLSQGGVALGLVSVVSEMLIEYNHPGQAHDILTTVIIGTVLSIFVGAYGAKYAVIKSGEANPSEKPVIIEEESIRVVHPHD
ncbi:MAG: cation:proton antiporter [Candidatus Heimdallarchaeota archaeon]|nr:cation:proton antiporter [Candidatus Heimdallarchaeota archaeon]